MDNFCDESELWGLQNMITLTTNYQSVREALLLQT
jgi:hypothetical protein